MAPSFDLASLDVADIGSWPNALQGICIATIAVVLLAFGYLAYLADKRAELALAQAREDALRDEFDAKRMTAAGFEVQRDLHRQVSALLAETRRRLPVEPEVPGLIEDITRAAADNHLVIDGIDLADERQVDCYVELPIAIVVSGDYHDLGAFLGIIAGLPRLVTFHDFDLIPQSGPRDLRLSIGTRIYRAAGSEPPPALSATPGPQSANLPETLP